MIEDEDVELLLADLLDIYGYDFTSYSKASLKRRIVRLVSIDKFPSFAERYAKQLGIFKLALYHLRFLIA